MSHAIFRQLKVIAMEPLEWLTNEAPGFARLTKNERDAMMHFAVLWSFFEARVFETTFQATKVQVVAQQWVDDGRLDMRPFREALRYFQRRYVSSAETNDVYDGLCLRKNDQPALVKKVLLEQSRSEADVVTAMLMIVYRLRNNLFHGLKWSDEIRGQLDNFTHASNLMMAALDINKYSPSGDELQFDD